MLKKNYYCLVAGLPDLLFDQSKSGLNILTFREELKEQLSTTDFNLAKQIFLTFDNQNLLNLLFEQNKPFNDLGIFSNRNLEDQIIKPTEIPEYMVQYIEWLKNQDSPEFSLQKENKLYHLFQTHILSIKNDFLSKWFTFQLNLKNILTAINCSQFNYDIKSQSIHIEANKTINNHLINSRFKHELFEEELPFAEQIFRAAETETNFIEKEKAIDKIKWNYLDEETFFHYFTIEKILSFVLKLIITERWIKLDAETGKELLNKLVKELNASYEFPPEFSLVK